MNELGISHHHQLSVWMAALCIPAPLHPAPGCSGLSLKQADVSGREGLSGSVGRTHQAEWERLERAHICSRRQSSPRLGYTRLEGCKASGPKLNRKTATICLHCYLCFKPMTGCQYKWGSLNLLLFRLLPQSLLWQVTSFKKHPMRMFPLLRFK